MAHSKPCFRPSKSVGLAAAIILAVGVALCVPLYTELIDQIEGLERDDFESSADLIFKSFSISMANHVRAADLVKVTLAQEPGPPTTTREVIDQLSIQLIAGYPDIISASYSILVFADQIEEWEETFNRTIKPLEPDEFFVNQSTFIVTTFLAPGLQFLEGRDLFSSSDNAAFWTEVIEKGNASFSRIAFNTARQAFTQFVVVPIQGSTNRGHPGSFLAFISLLPVLFDPLPSNPSVSATVLVNDTEVFRTSEVADGSSALRSCLPLPVLNQEWTFCFEGSESAFRRDEDRQYVLLVILFIGGLALTAVAFGVYVDYSSQKRISEAGATQRQIASWVCHDMRAPIGRLRQWQQLGPVSDDRLSMELAKMEGVTRNVLEVDRLMLGSFQPRLERVEIERWLLSLLADILPSKAADLHVSTGTDLPSHVSFDKGRLEQILVNIINNAVKHNAGGVIQLFVDRFQENLVLSVVNSGSNPLPTKQKLYKPPPNYAHAQRLHRATYDKTIAAFNMSSPVERSTHTVELRPRRNTSSNASSIGWGLTIVKMLAIGLGGDFEIVMDPESKVVTATVRLPLVSDETGIELPKSNLPLSSRQGVSHPDSPRIDEPSITEPCQAV